ncbi:MAG: glycosyltransferase family 4 protein [Planctomycetes bacterium]|nr:glycosyltransferase family 4 protein [Planctomycetota bacterium]
MKIALVIERLDPRLGGVEQWTWQFTQRLVQRGHEVHVVATRFAPETQHAGIISHSVPAVSSRTKLAEQLEQAVRRLAVDVIHDTGAGWHCDIFQPHGGSRLASFEQNLLLESPLLRPIKRGLAPYLPRYREFDRLMRRQYAGRARTFLALSRMVAHDMERFHRVRPEQIRLIYNGVDLERFTPALRSRHRQEQRDRLGVRDEVLLLIVAHNFELKGVPTLIRTVGLLRRQGEPVRLAVAGGKRLARYQRLAEKVGAVAAITFLGPVVDPAPWYAAADIYVQPTFYDPCSLVVLEALATGLPVVTSRFNGAGELLTPGIDGYLVQDPADVEELAQAIRPLLAVDQRMAMSIAARRLAEQHSLDRNCDQIVAVYLECAGVCSRAA